MTEIMAKAKYVVLERDDYDDVRCEECGSGDRDDELLLCDKCDKGFHMKCVSPIVVRVPIGSWLCPKCSGQRRVRSFSQKKIIDFFRIQKCKDAEVPYLSAQGDDYGHWCGRRKGEDYYHFFQVKILIAD